MDILLPTIYCYPTIWNDLNNSACRIIYEIWHGQCAIVLIYLFKETYQLILSLDFEIMKITDIPTKTLISICIKCIS